MRTQMTGRYVFAVLALASVATASAGPAGRHMLATPPPPPPPAPTPPVPTSPTPPPPTSPTPPAPASPTPPAPATTVPTPPSPTPPTLTSPTPPAPATTSPTPPAARQTRTPPPTPATPATTSPTPPAPRSPPVASGTCSKTYLHTFTQFPCAAPASQCTSMGFSYSGQSGSTYTFTDTLNGTFQSLTATLTGQSFSNPQYPFQQYLRVNGGYFGGFNALGLGGGSTVSCSNSCGTQPLVNNQNPGTYKVGQDNQVSLPLEGYITYTYPATGQQIYTFYFTQIAITVTTKC